MSPAGGTARRILYVQHRPEPSGASRALALLLEALDRDRFEPHVLCPPGPAAEVLRGAGAEVHAGPVATFTHIWASTYHGLRWALLGRELAQVPRAEVVLRRLLRNRGFALVHLNDSPLVHAAWAARRAGAPVVWHLRSALPGDGADVRSRLLRRAVRRLAGRAVAINEDVASSFGVGAVVVPDPVDLTRFRPGDPTAARDELGLPPDGPVVSFFGYLYPAKGYRELLRATALLHARGLEATLVLVGGAVRDAAFFRSPAGRSLAALGLARDHEREARELAAELGLGEHVRFVPRVPDPAPWYRASDVVAVPSQGPEVGLPALEAAAAGVPAVVTGTPSGGGIVVPDKTGLVARARTPEAIADALESLLRDPARRRELGAAARARAETSFGVGGCARRMEALYEALTGPGAGDRGNELG
jgi:glycosyltransferase involved in cell wall biosynthesis